MYNYDVGDMKDTKYLMFGTDKSSSVSSIGIAINPKVKEVLSKIDDSTRKSFEDYIVDIIVVFKSNLKKAYSYPCPLWEFDQLAKSNSLGEQVGKIRKSLTGNPAVKEDIDLSDNYKNLNLDRLRETGEDFFLNKTLLKNTAGYMPKPMMPLPRINISVSPIYSF